MSLEERIENEFKAALKERNRLKVSTLRLVKAEINNVRLKHDKNDLNDGEIIKIIQRQAAQRRDSIEQFEKGKREDLVEQEKKELAILLGYLPEQLSDDELKKIIEGAISELGASGKSQMGRVMKAVMERVKGKAEGKRVSRLVSDILS